MYLTCASRRVRACGQAGTGCSSTGTGSTLVVSAPMVAVMHDSSPLSADTGSEPGLGKKGGCDRYGRRRRHLAEFATSCSCVRRWPSSYVASGGGERADGKERPR